MKLVRFGNAGEEKPGIYLENGCGNGKPGIIDVRSMAFDIEDYDGFFFERHGLERLHGLMAEDDKPILPAGEQRLGCPVAPGGEVLCVGKNYADHAREFDAVVPAHPIFFCKARTALTGAGDPILIEPTDSEPDAEAELAVIIGKTASRVPEEDALGYVAGYTVLNDVTDRKTQREAGQWFLGKSPDTFCPVGPWLITPDEFDIHSPHVIGSLLNGEPFQSGNTQDMIFSVATLIASLSRRKALHPGDILATGTPSGVGFARTPPRLLKDGDHIEVSIEGIGSLANPVRIRPDRE